MLSLVGGKQPMAQIKTGKHKDTIIYIDPDDEAKGEHYAKIDLKANTLQPVMNPEKRSVWYIAAPAGAGKSTFAGQILMTFRKLNPKKPIYFFSRKDWTEDPAYKKVKPKQVMLDQTLVDNPIMLETDIEKGACCVFDDVGTIHDKAIKAEVLHLISDLLEVGRSRGISVVITSHLINSNDRAFTRTVLNELQHLVVFPRGSSRYQITYALDKYFGFTKKQIEEIIKLPSRWISISRDYPPTVMWEHGIMTIE